MLNWYDKPLEIIDINDNIDYIMCIDENGSASNLNYIKNKNNYLNDEKYFTITGCIFTRNEYLESITAIQQLKNKYWKNGCFFDEKSKCFKEVCFHSREIRRQENIYHEKKIKYNDFIIDLSITMKNINCKIISISIDLEKYIKCNYTYDVYQLAFDFLLERYIYNTKNHKQGIIMFEARGKQEDMELLKHINKVINHTGTKCISKNELQSKIIGVYFNLKWNKKYNSTYIGLEITDLYSYPIHKYVKRNVKDNAFITFENKIVGYPTYENKGIKKFP